MNDEYDHLTGYNRWMAYGGFLEWNNPQIIQIKQFGIETHGFGDPPF